MEEAILNGLQGLINGFLHLEWRSIVMILVGFGLLWLGIKKDCEPLLLVPIGFGCILVNIPLAGPDGSTKGSFGPSTTWASRTSSSPC